MADDIELRVGIQDDASKGIDQIAGKADDLARKKAEVKVGADTSDAEKGIESVESAAKAVADKPFDIDLRLKPGAAIDDELKRIAAEIKETAASFEGLGNDTVTFRANTDDLEKIQPILAGIDAEATVVDENTIDIKVNTNDLQELNDRLSATDDKVKTVEKSAGSSKSALANMVGNSAQDLGQLGGIAGSTGVAIGQMAEYMADAAFEGEALGTVVANFAKVAIPIAALTIAFQFLSSQAQKAEDDLKAVVDQMGQGVESVNAFAKANDDASRNILDLGNNLEALKFTLGIGEWDNNRHAVELFNEILQKSPAAAANLANELQSGLYPGLKLTSEQLQKMTDDVITNVQGQAAGKDATKDFNQAVTDYHTLLEHGVAIRQKDGESVADYFAKLREAAAAYEDLDAAAKHAQEAQSAQAAAIVATGQKQQDALRGIKSSLEDLNQTWDESKQSADAFSTVFTDQVNQGFKAHQAYADVEDGLGNLSKAVKDAGSDFLATGGHLTTFTEDGRNVLDAVQQLAPAIGQSLSAELQNAGGNFDTVREKASGYRDELVNQLTQLGLNSDEIQNYVQFLGLTPEQIETTIKLAGQEEARQKLQLLQSDISSLPESIKTEYKADVAAGDYEAALALLTGLEVDPNTGLVREASVKATTENVDQAQKDLQDLQTNQGAGYDVPLPTEATGTDQAKSDIQGAATNDGQGWSADINVGADTSDAYAELNRLAAYIRSINGDIATASQFAGNGSGKMAGGQIRKGGFVRVGEAGPETVFLPEGADVRTAGDTIAGLAQGGDITLSVSSDELQRKLEDLNRKAVDATKQGDIELAKKLTTQAETTKFVLQAINFGNQAQIANALELMDRADQQTQQLEDARKVAEDNGAEASGNAQVAQFQADSVQGLLTQMLLKLTDIAASIANIGSGGGAGGAGGAAGGARAGKTQFQPLSAEEKAAAAAQIRDLKLQLLGMEPLPSGATPEEKLARQEQTDAINEQIRQLQQLIDKGREMQVVDTGPKLTGAARDQVVQQIHDLNVQILNLQDQAKKRGLTADQIVTIREQIDAAQQQIKTLTAALEERTTTLVDAIAGPVPGPVPVTVAAPIQVTLPPGFTQPQMLPDTNININVQVDPTVPLAQAGAAVAKSLDAYYRTSGFRPRVVA